MILVRELNLLNLENHWVVHESVFAHKGLNGNLPKNIQNRYKQYLPKMSTRKSIKNLMFLNTTFQNLKNLLSIEQSHPGIKHL